MHVLVVDDELLARQRLVDLLEKRDDIDEIDIAEHGEEAIEMLENSDPDLVLLDVQMPGISGLELVREVGLEEMPPTIFVTAHDQYALRAFDLAAVDYLLKPFDDERFNQAFERAQDALNRENADELKEQLRVLIEERDEENEAEAEESLERLAVERRGETLIVPVEDVHFISASGPYLEVHTSDDTYLMRERLKTLEENLDDDMFFRIHRSTIVRLDAIEALANKSSGSYSVKLVSGHELPVSRRRRPTLEERLGLKL